MYLIEKHMSHLEIIIPTSPCFRFFLFCRLSFIRRYTWPALAFCRAVVKLCWWGHRVSFVYRNKVGAFMSTVSHSPFAATTSFPSSPSLSLPLWESCFSIGGTSSALWEAINECVACCDARHITAIHQSQETLDRRTANRLCNHITQPCQACHGSVSHSGL